MKAAVLVFPGSNREGDVAQAIELVTGRKPQMVWHGDGDFEKTDLIVLPGGFSYGDYLRCGAMAAQSPMMARGQGAAPAQGVPVLGICNGFQIAAEAGLLPGALMRNAQLKFVCRDVHLKVETSQSLFTSRYQAGQVLRMPVAHGEGNYFADAATLEAAGGSRPDRLPLCAPDGTVDGTRQPQRLGRATSPASATRPSNVLGLMPHPENARRAAARRRDGKALFEGWSRRSREHRVTSRTTAGKLRNEPTITPQIVAEHGLSADEYERILGDPGPRRPTSPSSASSRSMWSEHCSYKSSQGLPAASCRPRRRASSRARARTPASSTSATARPPSSRWRATTTPPSSSPTRARRPASAASCATSSPWARGRSPTSIRCASATPSIPRRAISCRGVVAGIGGYGNCMGMPDRGRRDQLPPPPTTATSWSTP